MTQKYFLIGLTGYAGTGKDTVRAILQDRGYIGLAFADPIRSMIRTLLTDSGIGDEWMDYREHKEQVIPALGVSYRHMAQTLGTEWGRNLQPDFWLRLAGAYMDDIYNDGDETHFVISDVRFENEADWVRARGGVIWRVHRAAATPVRPHASEAEIEHIAPSWHIHNNGSIQDLRERVFDAINATLP